MVNRRSFLAGGAMAAASALVPSRTEAADAAKPARTPEEGIGNAPFVVGEPCLQAPAETTMAVTWHVSGLAKGVVEIADNPEMKNARVVRGGGFGLVPIDASTLRVRLEGLSPATTYWYRTVTTPFTDYRNIYAAKLGKPVKGRVHSFTTLGAKTALHFAVMNDTHAQWDSFQLTVRKLKDIKPGIVIWNGDATNTTQKRKTAVDIFLDPPIADKDYAADLPTAFVCGNHDFRGSWISRLPEVVQPRHPAERAAEDWQLQWNFAVRMGDAALIGLDTGEDKPDAHPKWFGLANFEPYRKAQAAWLEKTLSRPDIAAAKYKVVFCHIPLDAPKDHRSYPHDGVAIDPNDYAHWSRECRDLWSPILARHGVCAVIVAHQHAYRFEPARADRPWAQIVGGGPDLKKKEPERFPTVIEGKIVDGRLTITVHNIRTGAVQATHVFG